MNVNFTSEYYDFIIEDTGCMTYSALEFVTVRFGGNGRIRGIHELYTGFLSLLWLFRDF